MHQVVGRRQAPLPRGEGLAARTADDRAALCRGDSSRGRRGGGGPARTLQGPGTGLGGLVDPTELRGRSLRPPGEARAGVPAPWAFLLGGMPRRMSTCQDWEVQTREPSEQALKTEGLHVCGHTHTCGHIHVCTGQATTRENPELQGDGAAGASVHVTAACSASAGLHQGALPTHLPAPTHLSTLGCGPTTRTKSPTPHPSPPATPLLGHSGPTPGVNGLAQWPHPGGRTHTLPPLPPRHPEAIPGCPAPACLLDQRGPGWQTRSVPRCQEHSPSLTSALGRGRGSPLGVGPAWTRPAPGHWALGSRPVCLLLPLTRLCLMIDNLPLE